MDSSRRQRSISLCQPHSTTPHPSRVGVPTRLQDALGCRPSTAGFPIPRNCCLALLVSLPVPCPIPLFCGPSHTPFPAPSPCPIIPCLYPNGSPATLWRGPTGSFSIQGPLRAPSTGPTLPAPVPFPCAPAPAYSLGLLCGPIPSLIPCSYPTGPPATLWRGPTGSSSIRGPFPAPSTGRSLPALFPCAAAPA